MSEVIQTPSGGFADQSSDDQVNEPFHGEDARWDEDLSPETREFVQLKTDEIHGQIKRTAEGVIKIGQNLIAVKEHLRHGRFLPWLKASFAMSENAALKFMQVAERFGSKSINVMNLPASVLYALAAPSTSDEVVDQVLSGEIEATLVSIKAAKEVEKKRADEAERAKQAVEQQLRQMQEEVATLQRQLSEQPQVIEKTVENPETAAALARLREKYAQKEEQLKVKTERVVVLSAELEKHAHRDEQETYRQQVRYKWRQACDAFHQGINLGMTRMATPLEATSAFEADDWARLADVENTLKRALSALSRLRESVSSQFVEGSVEH